MSSSEINKPGVVDTLNQTAKPKRYFRRGVLQSTKKAALGLFVAPLLAGFSDTGVVSAEPDELIASQGVGNVGALIFQQTDGEESPDSAFFLSPTPQPTVESTPTPAVTPTPDVKKFGLPTDALTQEQLNGEHIEIISGSKNVSLLIRQPALSQDPTINLIHTTNQRFETNNQYPAAS